MFRSLFFDALIISATMSLLSVAIMLIMKGKKRPIRSKWKCLCWTVLSLRFVLPFRSDRPLISFDLPAPKSSAAYRISELVPGIGETTQGIIDAASDAQRSASVQLSDYAVFLWLMGVLTFSVWHIAIYIISKRRFKNQSWEAEEKIQKKANEIALQMKIKRKIDVYVCSERIAPVLMGIIHPCVYLRDKMTDAQLEIVLRHELMHFRRGDIIYKFILTAANAIHWFNPIVWIMMRIADKDAESACDEAVMEGSSIEERKAYCNTILDMMSIRCIPFAAAMGDRKGDIMKRFKNIMNTSKRKSGLTILLLCISIIFCSIVGCTSGQKIEETPQMTTTTANTTTTTQTTTAETTITTAPTTVPTEDNSAWIVYEGGSYMDAARAMQLINDYRTRNGLPALWTDNESLGAAATDRAMEAMIQFSHTRPNGQRYSTILTERGMSYSFACENLARGQLTAEQVVNDWISSPDHQANLLNPNALYGCVICAKGYYDGMEYLYWVFMAYAP